MRLIFRIPVFLGGLWLAGIFYFVLYDVIVSPVFLVSSNPELSARIWRVDLMVRLLMGTLTGGFATFITVISTMFLFLGTKERINS